MEPAGTVQPPATQAIRIDVDGPVGRITLDRPARRNALDHATLEELATVAHWFDAQTPVKAVVVSGAGPAFCAGFDLADPRWAELGLPQQSGAVGRAMAEAIGSMRALTIAAVQGHCVGGGVVLAAACDLRVAAESATFRIPEVDLGVPLLWTGVPRLVREIGPARTKELVITGRPFDADEAYRIGFVNQVVADAELVAAATALAVDVASKPAFVIETTKRQVEEASPSLPASDLGADDDVAIFAAAFSDPECLEMAAGYYRRRKERSS